MRSIFLAVLVVLFANVHVVCAQENWGGKTVLIKKSPAKLRSADFKKVVAVADQIDFRVRADKDGHIEVQSDEKAVGWLDKQDVVLLANGVAFFTALI
ncbi:MAG TPA: hypothetical protein VFE62_26745 [Gemmataceae bacterium]|nr:hypothetical protein [Gemmataceae bacterium]